MNVWLQRTMFLFAALILLLESSPTTQALPKQQSQVRVNRETAADESLVTEYTDLRTGLILTAKARSSPERVAEWFSQVQGASRSDRPSEEKLKGLVVAGQSSGLLAVSSTIEGVSVTVSWGAPPKPRSTPGAIETTLQDRRTGKIIVAAGSASTDKTQEWLAATNAAKSEADLATLLSAEQSKGLISATMVVEGVKIATFWAIKQR